ncbi:hypothetical protein A4X13_0g2098 [Tilletia indica]|uniref:Uncharacterized protein n=1 Tax=Tilletia indica TaxID=43049 RepID=A0A8T8TBJ1_9BASI|nr:hypothetical protein A4X13_0g2098 [Tilletia indica]
MISWLPATPQLALFRLPLPNNSTTPRSQSQAVWQQTGGQGRRDQDDGGTGIDADRPVRRGSRRAQLHHLHAIVELAKCGERAKGRDIRPTSLGMGVGRGSTTNFVQARPPPPPMQARLPSRSYDALR